MLILAFLVISFALWMPRPLLACACCFDASAGLGQFSFSPPPKSNPVLLNEGILRFDQKIKGKGWQEVFLVEGEKTISSGLKVEVQQRELSSFDINTITFLIKERDSQEEMGRLVFHNKGSISFNSDSKGMSPTVYLIYKGTIDLEGDIASHVRKARDMRAQFVLSGGIGGCRDEWINDWRLAFETEAKRSGKENKNEKVRFLASGTADWAYSPYEIPR